MNVGQSRQCWRDAAHKKGEIISAASFSAAGTKKFIKHESTGLRELPSRGAGALFPITRRLIMHRRESAARTLLSFPPRTVLSPGGSPDFSRGLSEWKSFAQRRNFVRSFEINESAKTRSHARISFLTGSYLWVVSIQIYKLSTIYDGTCT